MNISKKFNIFLALNLILWSCIPLLRLSMSMDTQEAIVWGKYCLWGTTKHPPFSGWLAYGFYQLFHQHDISMYLLSQLCVLTGIIYIYKLARLFLSQTSSILAAMLQFGIIYYQFSTPEYNVNVVSIALWPAASYYFWRAYNENKLHQWLLFAIFTALNLLNKYTAGLLLFAQGIFIIADKGFPSLCKNYRVYLAALLGFALIFPHIYWLYKTDFTSFNYIAERNHSGNIISWWRHLFYPLKFLFAQILFSAAAWITYFTARINWGKSAANQQRNSTLYILCIALIPLLTLSLLSFIQGSALKSMWGFPMLFTLGISLFYFFPLRLNERNAAKLFYAMMFWSFAFAVAYAVQCCVTTSERYRADGAELAKNLQQQWNEYTQQPLEYVAAEVWYADIMALQSSYHIKPMIWFKPQNNPWFDAADFHNKGALVIANNADEYHYYESLYPQKLTPPQTLALEFKNMFGKTKTKDIYYGFYNVKEAKYDQATE